MKRILCTLLMIVMMFSLCSCKDSESVIVEEYETISTNIGKESIEEFISLLKDFEPSGLIDGCKIEKDNCFDVTPPQVATETDMKIFKFSDSCASYVMLYNEIYPLCEWFGGYGFVNAVPCDFDGDGNKDLLVASSWGSGMHRSVISVFNSVTKESLDIIDTSDASNPDIDLIVESVETETKSECYQVYSAEIIINDEVNYNLADLSYVPIKMIGSIENKNGTPIFIPCKE